VVAVREDGARASGGSVADLRRSQLSVLSSQFPVLSSQLIADG
jgi:hypothetical protein